MPIYKKLHFSVIQYVCPLFTVFRAFLNKLLLCSVFSFPTFRLNYEQRSEFYIFCLMADKNVHFYNNSLIYQRFPCLKEVFVVLLLTLEPFLEGGVCPLVFADAPLFLFLSDIRALSIRILAASSPKILSSLLFLGF